MIVSMFTSYRDDMFWSMSIESDQLQLSLRSGGCE